MVQTDVWLNSYVFGLKEYEINTLIKEHHMEFWKYVYECWLNIETWIIPYEYSMTTQLGLYNLYKEDEIKKKISQGFCPLL